MVHKICKQENYINSIIYGCVTDGEMFSFLRIDNDGKVRAPIIILWYNNSYLLFICLFIVLLLALPGMGCKPLRKKQDMDASRPHNQMCQRALPSNIGKESE